MYHLNTSPTAMQNKMQSSPRLHHGFLWTLETQKGKEKNPSQQTMFVEAGPEALQIQPSLHERMGF